MLAMKKGYWINDYTNGNSHITVLYKESQIVKYRRTPSILIKQD